LRSISRGLAISPYFFPSFSIVFPPLLLAPVSALLNLTTVPPSLSFISVHYSANFESALSFLFHPTIPFWSSGPCCKPSLFPQFAHLFPPGFYSHVLALLKRVLPFLSLLPSSFFFREADLGLMKKAGYVTLSFPPMESSADPPPLIPPKHPPSPLLLFLGQPGPGVGCLVDGARETSPPRILDPTPPFSVGPPRPALAIP